MQNPASRGEASESGDKSRQNNEPSNINNRKRI